MSCHNYGRNNQHLLVSYTLIPIGPSTGRGCFRTLIILSVSNNNVAPCSWFGWFCFHSISSCNTICASLKWWTRCTSSVPNSADWLKTDFTWRVVSDSKWKRYRLQCLLALRRCKEKIKVCHSLFSSGCFLILVFSHTTKWNAATVRH